MQLKARNASGIALAVVYLAFSVLFTGRGD